VAENELSAEQLEEQIRKLKIEDIVLSTVSTLGQLAYAKLDARELDQARLAIDGMAALLPLLEGHAEAQILRDFNQLLANVRLSYANTVSASGSEPQTPSEAPGTEPAPGETAVPGDESVSEPSKDSGSGTEPQTPSGPP
jgi:hypothetical protein